MKTGTRIFEKQIFMKQIFTILTLSLASVSSFSQAQDGPHAPDMTYSFQSGTLTLILSNPANSNNSNENYEEKCNSFSTTAPDSMFRFQGYLIYQLASCNFYNGYMDTITGEPFVSDPSKARLVAQSDIADSYTTFVNEEENLITGNCAIVNYIPVSGNSGTFYSYDLTIDAFTNQPFAAGNIYSFTARAYAINSYYKDATCSQTAPVDISRQGANGSMNLVCFDPATASVGEIEKQNTNISVYPNPAEENFTIQLSQPRYYSVSVLDILGKIIYTTNFIGDKISLGQTEISKGIYFIHIKSDNKIIGTEKLIIK